MSSPTPKVPPKARSKARARPEPVPTASSTRKSKPAPSTSDRKIPTHATTTNDKPASNDNTLFRVNFEVRGKVQGVHFRKYTQLKGTSLGLRGWCQNTNYSSVIGCMEGPRIKLEQMKQWLKSTGSPKSIISGAEFKETLSERYTLTPGFQIVK